LGDYRPLNGEVTLSSDRNDISVPLMLYRQLGCTPLYQSTSVSTPTNSTLTGSTYRLYPGGPTYSIPVLDSNVSNQTLQADIDTNPLGIFRRQGSITLKNNVRVEG